MSIKFVPKAGTVLLCDYSTGFVPPEMTKRRPVVVLSPRKHPRNIRDTTVLVAPFSTRMPRSLEPYHVHIPAGTYPFFSHDSWVKADMISAVSLARLSLLQSSSTALSTHHFLAVQRAVLNAFGFAQLTALV